MMRSELSKAIQQKKLNGFDEITPIYKQEFPLTLPNSPVDASPRNGQAAARKTAQEDMAAEAKAAREAAVVRNDNNRRPHGNDRYGQRNQSDPYGNNPNHYDNNRREAPTGPNPAWLKCGLLKFNGGRLPWLKSAINPNGPDHPPKIGFKGGPLGNICLKGSTSMQACTRRDCKLIHLTHTCEVTGGMYTLNKYVKKFKDLEWVNAEVCKMAAKARPGPFDGKDL